VSGGKSNRKRAVRAARGGHYVFPTFPAGHARAKQPRTENGFHAATRDESQIREWWGQWPDSAVGVAVGMAGLSVVDLDVHDDANGIETLSALGLYEPTEHEFTSLSGNGRHVWFQGLAKTAKNVIPEGFEVDGKTGIDTRGPGGYVVLAYDPPAVEDITTPLPVWVPRQGDRPDEAPLSTAAVDDWLDACLVGEMTPEVRSVVDAIGYEGEDRSTIHRALVHLAGLASEGHTGVREAVGEARERYLRDWQKDPRHRKDFEDSLAKAAALKGTPGSAHLDWLDMTTEVGGDDFEEFEDESAETRAREAEVLRALEALEVREEARRRFEAAQRGERTTIRERLLGIEDVLALPAPEPLIDGVLDRSNTVVLFGAPATGKSFVALHWAWAVASGSPWLGRDVRPGRALYVAAEGAQGLGERIRALSLAWPAEVEDRLRFHTEPINLTDAGDVAEVSAIVAEDEVDLIVVDTLARTSGDSEENSATAMSTIISALDTIRRANPGATIVVVHHSGKGGDLRGSSALLGGADSVLSLSGDDARTLAFKKRKEGPVGSIVDLAFDPVVGTSSGVMSAHRGRRAPEENLSDRQDEAIQLFSTLFSETDATRTEFRKALEGHGVGSEATVNRVINELVKRGLLDKPNATRLAISSTGRRYVAEVTDQLDPPTRKAP